jgi:hypothetical protein
MKWIVVCWIVVFVTCMQTLTVQHTIEKVAFVKLKELAYIK